MGGSQNAWFINVYKGKILTKLDDLGGYPYDLGHLPFGVLIAIPNWRVLSGLIRCTLGWIIAIWCLSVAVFRLDS